MVELLRIARTASRTLWIAAAMALLAAAGNAGTGRLVSPWMSRAPQIDGFLADLDGEWREAITIDLGLGVSARLGNDGRTLYVAVIDARPGAPSLNRAILFFEDEGGAQPQLDDDSWTTADCQANAALGEGEIWFPYSVDVDTTASFYEWRTNGGGSSFCPAQPVESRMRFRVLYLGGAVTYEMAIPLDGPGPIRAGPGQRLGFELRALDNAGGNDACYPACAIDPPSFRNLILASGGCNTGPQGFGSGQPQIGLPLDWSGFLNGTGQGWVQSTVFADPVFCQENVTGGAGAAACVSDALYGAGENESLLSVPVSLALQSTARMRLLANFQPGELGAFLKFGVRRVDQNFNFPLSWFESHGGPSGPGEAVEVDLPMTGGNFPVELAFLHDTLSGSTEGGFAEIDDVELLCGPVLFADGFDSGLSTHWSSTAP